MNSLEEEQRDRTELLEEKKKTNLLRKALKQEREEKLRELQEAADKIGILECTIAEKVRAKQDSKIEMLKLEKENLLNEAQLTKEVKEAIDRSPSPTQRPGRAIEVLEQQNKHLLEEVHSLLNDTAKLHERLKTTEK
jgi:hypothetical protein